jgi:predicted nucleic acid-binding protein
MKKSSAYVDTGAFISFLDRSDSYHDLFARLFAEPPPLWTTPLVLAEGHAWFLRRYDSPKGLQFSAFIEELPGMTITSVGPKEVQAATAYLRKFQDQRLTLADALGLHVIHSQKLRVVWTTDRHLGLTGAELIIHLK